MINVLSIEEKQVVLESLQEYKDKLVSRELKLIEIAKNRPILDVEIKELEEAYAIMIDLIDESKNEDPNLIQEWKKNLNDLHKKCDFKRTELSYQLRKNEGLLKDIPLLKKFIQHGEFLISKINSFETIEEIPLYNDFGFLKPMNIGYDYDHPEPMEFILEETTTSVWDRLGTNNTIFKFSENSLQSENGKTLEFNDQQKSEFLFLFKHFEIKNNNLNDDHMFQNLVDNNHLQLLDINIIDGGSSTSTNFSCTMNIYDIESSWSGTYLNAPLRLKFVINYLLSLSK